MISKFPAIINSHNLLLGSDTRCQSTLKNNENDIQVSSYCITTCKTPG